MNPARPQLGISLLLSDRPEGTLAGFLSFTKGLLAKSYTLPSEEAKDELLALSQESYTQVALNCFALHCSACFYIALQCFALPWLGLLCIALNCAALLWFI